MMREPEKMAFEDRVLAYLDGALDDASSERLLAEIAQDTEKQEIFASHQELDKLIMTARVPLETPEETRRSIAAVIPGLTTYLPEFITTGTTVSLLATRWRAILDFFTQTPLRTALTIGGAAAVVTTGVIVSNMPTNNSGSSGSASHVERSVTMPPTTSAPFVQPDIAVESGTKLSDGHSTSGALQSSSSNAPSTNAASTNAASTNLASTNLAGTSTARNGSTNNGLSMRDRLAQSGASNLDLKNEVPLRKSAHTDVSNSHTANSSAVKLGGSQSDEPRLDKIGGVSAKDITGNLGQPSVKDHIVLPMYGSPFVYTEPMGLTFTAGFATRLLFKPAIGDQKQSPDIGTPWTASVRYHLSGPFSLMGEGGTGAFVRVRQTGSLVQSYGALQHVAMVTTLHTDNAYWARLGAEYMFVDESAHWAPFTTATVGAAFLQSVAPMVGIGAGVKAYLSDRWRFLASVGYDETWVSRESQPFAVPESAVVDVQDLRGGSVVSNSALSFSIGLSSTF